MNTQLVAVVIAEGFRLVGQLYRNRPIQLKAAPATPTTEPVSTEIPEKDSGNAKKKATEIATGCVPCAIGHFGTCSGLLNEAMRFAHSDGIQSDEVIDRVGKCLDELNVMERVDLQPEMIVSLPDWERELADQALEASRTTRHALEAYASVDALEKAAADTQSLRTQIFRSWIKRKMEHLTPEEQVKIQKRVIKKLNELVPEEEEENNGQT